MAKNIKDVADDDDLPKREVYRAIESEFLEHDHNGTGKTLIGSMYGNLLPDIEEFVKEVCSTDQPAFRVEGKRVIALRLGAHFRRMLGYLAQQHRGFTFSLPVERFFTTADKWLLPLTFSSPSARIELEAEGVTTEGEIFHRFITDLRQSCSSEDFKKELRRQGLRSNRRYRRLVAYVDQLFALCSRLLVIRIDLKYKGEGEPITLERVLADYSAFVNNRRHNSLFKHLVGSIRRLEFGALRDHHHFHVILFFDGSEVRKDEFLADQVGKYWIKVTGGRGWYFNCNRGKTHRYRRVGIGMISHYDTRMRSNLLLALKYLVKKEQLLWVKPGQKVRAIECGRVNKAHSGRGRPRLTRP